ncbi:hypothetical protein QZH41_011098, partial [Actinostola sp. cb2023]
MADRMASDGYRDAGYVYVSIDDCWASHNRTSSGQLQPDPKRFPSGIPALSKYIHSKGLKFGIYGDYGTHTCAGYPGSIDHVQQDMQTFADWGVDYLKLDGCYANPKSFDTGYPSVTKALNNTGRPIVFSCSWPAYQVGQGVQPDYQRIAKYCNLWRNYNDIQDSWDSVTTIVEYYAKQQDVLIAAAGPGHWNDPDELIIGDFGLSEDESKAQFAIWAIMASPLIISTDLRHISSLAKDILLNKEVIAVNQDKLGKQGRQVLKANNVEVWCRPLSDGSVAIVLFSRHDDLPVSVKASFRQVGFPATKAHVRDLFLHEDLGVFENSFSAKVNPSGVVMVKLTAVELTMASVQFSLVLVLLSQIIIGLNALDNGLARKPPMGWMAWERFRCNVDCGNDPEHCISEELFKEMADRLASDGFKEAGYEYICIDDCWSAMNRTDDGKLVADVNRFPSGIKKLADYVSILANVCCIYVDYGTKTCAGYPGSINHVYKDAETFADWGVDYLKLDGCYASPLAMDEGYPLFSWALNRTGRAIMFSCSWPAYQVFAKIEPDYRAIGKFCNLWRNYGDIQDSWTSLEDIVDWYGDNQYTLIKAASPGQWNDPDQLIIGNFGLSYEQSRAQFAIWAILAAVGIYSSLEPTFLLVSFSVLTKRNVGSGDETVPLMMSNDLRDLDKKFKDILLNKEIIAVNQDPLGRQGRRVLQNKKANTEVWRRYLSDGGVAVVLLSKREDMPVYIEVPFWRIGVRSIRARARDLFAQQDLGIYERSFLAKVNPSGVVMVKITSCCEEHVSLD